MTENQQWPPYVHRSAAADGYTPDDFRFDQWAVSNVHLRHIDVTQDEHFPDEIALIYGCDLPADTPLANQYDDVGNKIPDPAGIVLQSVQFDLYDADTGEELDHDVRASHVDGKVTGLLGGPSPLWKRLTPGASVRVRLTAYPRFFFLNEAGDFVGYAIGNQGYFRGADARSDTYTLSMTEQGEVLIDGAGRPQLAAPAVELPADYQVGQTFGQYIRARREAAGLSASALGQTTSQPWKMKDGGETYDPRLWIEWLEAGRADLKIEWEGQRVLNENLIYGLAASLGVDGGLLCNLAKQETP